MGSSLVTNNGERLDHAAIAKWAGQMASLLKARHEVLMVSSGAIAKGMQRLGWTKRLQEIHQLQAAAAVGQMGLVQVYESCFARFNLRSAQVLLINADLADAERNANARATLDTLLRLGVVPIINENDTVVTDEIKFGDNDSLAALVTNLINADLLIILTDQGGLFMADPRQNDVLENMQQAKVSHALCVSVDLPDFPNVLKLAQDHANLYASVGVHPDPDATLLTNATAQVILL